MERDVYKAIHLFEDLARQGTRIYIYMYVYRERYLERYVYEAVDTWTCRRACPVRVEVYIMVGLCQSTQRPNRAN